MRGLLALNLAAAAAGAMVLVNTVLLVHSGLGMWETDVAIALCFIGGGSMLAALLLPRILDKVPDRPVMMVFGAVPALITLAALAVLGVATVVVLWPAADLVEIAHDHPAPPSDHPYISDRRHHRNAFLIDDQHQRWRR